MISPVRVKDFFSLQKNSFAMNFYYFTLVVFFFKCLVNSNFYLTFFFIFLVLINMTKQTIQDVMFASETFVIVYLMGIGVLYERMISSIINFITKTNFDRSYSDYYISTIIVAATVFIVVKRIYLRYLKKITVSIKRIQKKLKTKMSSLSLFILCYKLQKKRILMNSGLRI